MPFWERSFRTRLESLALRAVILAIKASLSAWGKIRLERHFNDFQIMDALFQSEDRIKLQVIASCDGSPEPDA